MKKIAPLTILIITIGACNSKTPEQKAKEQYEEIIRNNKEAENELRRKTDSLLEIINAPTK